MYHNNDFEIQKSRDKLVGIFGDSPDLVFVRAWGNIGDELIYAGMRQLLSGFDYREVSIQNLQNVSGHTALVAGSGGWCKPFHSMPSFLPIIEERFQSVIVLPSTFDTSEKIVRHTLKKTNALIFARDLVSYRQIQPLCKADIAHDCAFFFDYEKYKSSGKGILNAFRTDAESNNQLLPENNIDISVVCSSLDEWLWTISKYDLVRTDRAHVMIAAAMLGKQVEYKSSNYHKVPAIAEYALKEYPVMRIPESSLPKPAITQAEDHSPISRFAFFLAERFAASNVVFVDDIESLSLNIKYSKDDIVVIRNAISSLERFPQLIDPLKKIFQEVQKVILTDDVHSFPDTKTIEAFFKFHEIPVEFFGYVNALNQKAETLALISTSNPPLPIRTPDNFRVIALISSYNEEDIIIPAIEQLHRNGVDVYLIDNWSTDDTYQKAQSLLGKGLIGLEKFPSSGPSNIYDWKGILERKEKLCQELKANWFIHHDVDEIHESPWKGVRLRDAIYRADQQGYNAIDFTVLNFFPVDNNYQPGTAFSDYFKFFEFSNHLSHIVEIRAWKAMDGKVVINESGGHNADFFGRKVYPYKFLLRHYPLRSQLHGEKKIFQDRKQRYSVKERKAGWHNHYDACVPGTSFLKNPQALIEFNSQFYSDYLIERLSGIGIIPPEMEKIEKLENHIAQREQYIQTLSSQIQMLSPLVQSLEEIKNSRAWRIALLFRKIRVLIAPPNSRRAHILRRIANVSYAPCKKLFKK